MNEHEPSTLKPAAGNGDPRPQLLELAMERDARRLRASAGALMIALAIALVWISPWLPGGLPGADYGLREGAGYLLLAGSGAIAVAFTWRWAPLLMDEPRSEIVRALLGESLSVRNRSRFLSCLRFQCARERSRGGGGFAVVTIALVGVPRTTGARDPIMRAALATVRGCVRARDVVGDPGTNEVWLLLHGSAQEGAAVVCRRIESALRRRVPEFAGEQDLYPLRTGVAVFEMDGREALGLMTLARRSAGLRDGPLDLAA